MENRTKFNLENNINNWKSFLNKKNNLTQLNVIELESHLLDLIDDLQSKGLDDEEAFFIARKRIGKIDDISLEFDKINSDFSFINTINPYIKGALTCIAFLTTGKLLLVLTLLLSEYLSVNNSTFNLISLVLLVIYSISFFGLLHLSFKKRNSFLKKYNNVFGLVMLVFVSFFISTVLSARIIIPGIDASKLGVAYTIPKYHSMELYFGTYKVLCGIGLLVTSLILLWKNKKHNKLRYIK